MLRLQRSNAIVDPSAIKGSTSGHVLTAKGVDELPVFEAPATPAAGIWTPIGTETTASAQANVDIVLGSGNVEHMIRWRHVAPASNDVGLFIRLSNDGGSTFTAAGNLYKSGAFGISSNAAQRLEGAATNQFYLDEFTDNAQGVGSDPDEDCAGWVVLVDALDASYRTRFYGMIALVTAANEELTHFFGGAFTTPRVDDAVRFFFETGNIQTGAFRQYGIAT